MHRIEPKTSPQMKARSKRLRKDAPIPERILWNLLRAGRLDGLKFRRQQALGPYVADFYCESAKLVVELDGLSHIGQEVRDDARDAYFRARGLDVVRVSNDELLRDRVAVCGIILEAALESLPSPLLPLPRGEGQGEGRFPSPPGVRRADRGSDDATKTGASGRVRGLG